MVREHRSLRLLLLGILLTLVAVNAMQFATRASNPLVSSDGWSAVDSVVRQATAGQLDVADLFIKRSAFDHSQPLRKLILLFHYRYFDLDFSVEAIIGVLFAFTNLAALWFIAGVGRDRVPLRTREVLLFSALAAVYLSLNASVIFSWSLVTLAYTSHTFLLAFLAMAWASLDGDARRRLPVLFAVSLLMDVVTDDTGVIATLAAMLAVALQAWRSDDLRRGAMVAATIALACIVYRVGYAWLVPLPVAQHATLHTSGAIGRLLAQAPQAWSWVATPLVASVAHLTHLRDWAGARASLLEAAIACALVLAHAWFWWRALRGRSNLASFVAVGLMLLFYGLVAGMLIARVSVNGIAYLWQPRYVVIYAWNIVALLLMAMAQRETEAPAEASRTTATRIGGGVAIAAAVALLLLQVPLSVSSWKGLRGVSVYQQRMAFAIGELATHPALPPGRCMPQIVVCNFPRARRVRVLMFLKQNRLNLFSPAFQARNRLYPSLQALPD